MNESKTQLNQDSSENADSLTQFISRSLRGPKAGVYERILCQRLILSAAAHPLRAAQLITSAALMVPKEDLEKIEINFETVKVISIVANVLSNPIERKHEIYGEFKLVEWGLKTIEENYEFFIAPWRQEIAYQSRLLRERIKWTRGFRCSNCGQIYYQEPRNPTPEEFKDWHQKHSFPDKCTYCRNYTDYHNEKNWTQVYQVINDPKWMLFFDATENAIQPQGYQALVNSFIIWAQPQVEEISRKLAGLINPNVYDEMLKTMGKPEEPDV